MKNLCILGATGSIGRNTLAVVSMFPDRFRVRALTAKRNVDLLARQIRQCKPSPEVAAVYDAEAADRLESLLTDKDETRIVFGDAGYREAASLDSVDMVVSAMVGAAGLGPTLAGIDSGKDIALANKETLVMAGAVVMRRAAERGVRILPVDSEHSAVFQCIQGNEGCEIEKIFLTASGGPFFDRPAADFSGIRPEDALKHPNWRMGSKITIDSATLMNKGFEVIEALHLFGLTLDKIEVIVHPQSIVHSMVAFGDGSVMAQLGVPDMKTAIAYALSHPERLPLSQPLPDFAALGSLNFYPPDFNKFPCLGFAFSAFRSGGTMPAVLNAANEIAVGGFLSKQIDFPDIWEVIRRTMSAHDLIADPNVEQILQADAWARHTAESLIYRLEQGTK